MLQGQAKPWLHPCGCIGHRDGSITRCPLHASAPDLLAALKAMLKANDELMTEFISKKRAANWGVINQAGVDAGAAIRKAEGGR